mmetsp:Transcript_36662/g.74728  ORF Transcript_36662/g.74728 Transcript_36662/m.74728 type:complete len:123 (+) Transcript_36662:1717-2085(+)
MKAFSTVLSLLSVASTSAFIVPVDRAAAAVSPTRLQMAADRSPELEAAISDVRECASSFSDETAHFANAWIDKMLEGKQDGMAAGLLDECLIEGDNAEKCAKYEAALKKLDSLLGVGAGEQY